ncbi:Hypothetical predicted protein [Mytilus galloprovincialis]|uniref:SEA domain-containing protein n=1 Tax=Mytilus galloprovincialis TaxID=29158 RepID=A0A8B6CX21_MYTGA|nr:Hypothetical predicted protein [Mytilus galloprovincialis]
MADNKYLGKTAPDLGRSNVYDSAGDGKTFHLNEIPKWRLGNSYSAGFDYFSNVGENIAESDHGVSESRKQTGSYNNRAFEKSTKSLSATQDTKTAVSSSTRLDQSADYTDDASSSSSNGDNRQDEQMLTWRKMLLDPLTAGQFLSKQWPRISLRASYKRKEPYVAPDEEDADLDLKKEENDTKRRRKYTISAIISGILLVVIAIIPVIVITSLQKDEDSSKLYVRVNMTVEINRTFTQTLMDPGSQDYKSLTDGFCYEIGKVYTKGYHGCKVSNLKNGSIIVNYIIYFTGIPVTDAANESEMTLNNYLNGSSSHLGPFVINQPIVVYSVSVESLTTPPTVQGETAPNSVSSSLDLSLLETSGIMSTLGSTSLQSQIMSSSITDYLSTMETTMQSTESLQSEQQTTKNSFSSPLETSNFATISTTVPISQTEFVTLIESPMQTLILSSEPSLSIDQNQLVTTTSEYLEPGSNSFELSTSSSFKYVATDALSNGVPLISDTSVDITTMVAMSMTSSGLSDQTDNMQTFSPTYQTTSLETTVTSTDDTLSTATLTNETTASTNLLTDESTTTNEITNTTEGNIFETNTTPDTTLSPDNTTTLSMTTNTTEKETLISETYQTSGQTTTYSITSTPESNSTSATVSSTEAMSTNSTEATSLKTTTTPNTSVSYGSTQISTGAETEITTPSTIETTLDNTKSTDKESAPITSLSTEEETSTFTTVTMDGSTADKTIPTPTVFSTEKSTTEIPTMETTDLSSTEQTSSSTESQSFVLSCTNITANLYSGSEIMTCTIGNAYDYNQIGILRGNISNPLLAMRVFRNGSTEVNIGHPDITVYFDKSTQLTLTFRNISDEIFGTYDILLLNRSGDPIAETKGILSLLIHELSCTDISDAELYFGPFAMICMIPKFEIFDYIGFYHEGGLNNSLFGILMNKDGSIYKTYENNSDIEIDFQTTSSIFKLIITFKNVSCAMDGIYSIVLLRHVSNNLDAIITSATGHLQVTRQHAKPTLTLNADQVIDLIFPTNFYRDTGFHTCEGGVGYPTPSTLMIDIMYTNGTRFQQIPDGHIYRNASRTFGECQTVESLKFAIKFTEEMDGAKLRCSVDDSSDDYTSSENLTLIPRNICNCGGAKRGHPKNCKVQVLCIKDADGTIYPRGLFCPSDLCRNSFTGDCSNNCSDAVCQEEVPQDFCTTPDPPTTTPIPSAYIVCNDSTVPLYSGPVDIKCILNETSFTMINITFKSSTTSNSVLKATINNKRNVSYLIPDDNFSISLESDVLTISIKNATCSTDGIYGVTVDLNNVIKEEAIGKLTISSNPGQPLITMHTDQIVDLGYYRGDRLHTCTGDVGVPSTHLIIDETVKFGISFTSEMNGGKVRCSINGSSVNSTKNEIDLALIPRDICNCGKHSDTIGHPQSCYAYVLCEKIQGIIYPYGISCPSGECRNSITGICSANCSQAVCDETVPSGFCTTPAPMLPTVAPSQDIQCYGNSTFQFSGKVQIVCVLNQTEFTSMNVTFETTKQSNLIAQIASNRTVKMVDTSGKIDVQISSKTVTVELLNASCIDSGLYVVRMDFGSETAIAQGQLTIKTKPDKPSLEVPFHTVENQNIQIICTGNTGNPAGSLQVLIKRLNVSDTIKLSSDSVQVIQKPEICSYEETVTIEQKLTSEWNLTTIKCQAVNQETITDEDDSIYYTSEESQIVLIEENYCSTGELYKYHPKSCYHYVWCTIDRMFPSQCAPPLCFFNATDPCSNCNEAPAPCTEP